jgi:hypothetical protein
VFNITLLGMGVFVRLDVRRKDPYDQLNSMIFLQNKLKTFGHPNKGFGMIVDKYLEI